MKRKLSLALGTGLFLAATATAIVSYLPAEKSLLEQNLEALTDIEDSDTYLACSMTITSLAPDEQDKKIEVFYCSTCSWVPGRHHPSSGMGLCRKPNVP